MDTKKTNDFFSYQDAPVSRLDLKYAYKYLTNFYRLLLLLYCVAILPTSIISDMNSVETKLVIEGTTFNIPSRLCYSSLAYILFFIITSLYYFFAKNRVEWETLRTFNLVCAFLFAIPFLFLGLYVYDNLFFKKYAESKEREYLHESHKMVGYVYRCHTEGFRYQYDVFSIGIDEKHTRDHRMDNYKGVVCNVGDTVILRVSDEYPRVNQVLNWHPTHEEIEKYMTPVKLIE